MSPFSRKKVYGGEDIVQKAAFARAAGTGEVEVEFLLWGPATSGEGVGLVFVGYSLATIEIPSLGRHGAQVHQVWVGRGFHLAEVLGEQRPSNPGPDAPE